VLAGRIANKQMKYLDIQLRVYQLISEQFYVSLEEINSHKFLSDFHADSLDGVELVMMVEDAFNFHITDDEAEKYFSANVLIQEIVSFVADKLATQIPTQTKESPKMSLANIKLASFDYTKADGTTRSRSVVVVDESDERVLGLEIKNGDLTAVQPYLAYTAELAEITEHLKAKYGLNDKTKPLPYKSFKQTGIAARNDVDLTIDL
jgi:acyl carrier protein